MVLEKQNYCSLGRSTDNYNLIPYGKLKHVIWVDHKKGFKRHMQTRYLRQVPTKHSATSIIRNKEFESHKLQVKP